MKRTMLTRISGLLIAGAMAGAAFSAAPVSPSAACADQTQDWNFPAEASGLLAEIRTSAAILTRTTDTLESHARHGLNWQSHADELTVARTHINAIGERLARLQTIREVSAPWQREALDSILPSAVQLAERTEAAIRHLNENRRTILAETYKDHVRAMTDHANQVKQAVDLHLEFQRTQNQLDALRFQMSQLG